MIDFRSSDDRPHPADRVAIRNESGEFEPITAARMAGSDDDSWYVVGGMFRPNTADIERQRASERAGRDQQRTTAYVARVIAGHGFRSEAHMIEVACELVVERQGRALTSDEHARVVLACRELRQAVAAVERYEVTTQGRAAMLAHAS